MSTSREVVLLLADLSGYTAYLAASEPERAPALAADLVETVVRQLRPTFRLEKLEGDAAFMVAPTDRLTGPALLDAIDATTAAFRTRLRSLAQSTTCDCEACRRIPELGLKFVVHAGDVVTQRVAGRTELAGVAAIVAHRLLKAETPSNLGLERYALLTDACVHHLGLDPEALASPDGVAMLAGNRLPEGAEPIAQAYAGHQFGNFVPQLGDGRVPNAPPKPVAVDDMRLRGMSTHP